MGDATIEQPLSALSSQTLPFLQFFARFILACWALLITPHHVACAAPEARQVGSKAAPVYLAQTPEPFVLHYQIRKGGLVGNGELRWKPTASGYDLTLEGKVLGLRLLHQVSQGVLSVHGLAPRFFSDQRLRGAAQSATFDVGSGLIRYAGRSELIPWVAGVQDRLSWMVQLPAVLQAQPQLQVPGQQVLFFVSGARADADEWIFQCIAREDIQTPQGSVASLKWVRQPRKPNDSLVEVWLDPARQWLPVRAKFGHEADSLALSLQEIRP